MLAASLACVVLAFAQEAAPVPGTPFDRVIELEITASDEPAIEGHGPTAFAEYEVEFDGTLHIWTASELDLFLQVDDAAEARILASDDNSGGGTTPYIAYEAQRGDWLVIFVAGGPGEVGALTLHLVATPESEAGRAAERAGRRAIAAAARLVEHGEHHAARETLAGALAEIESVSDAFPDLLDALDDLGASMYGLGDLSRSRSIFDALIAAYEYSLPEDHPDLLLAQRNLATLMYEMGELTAGRELLETAVAGYERNVPEDHAHLLGARATLGVVLYELGELAEARLLLESVVAGFERTLPADHRHLLSAQANLANPIEAMGDLALARALRESVLAGYERTLPEDHPDVLFARGAVASSMENMGALAEAHALRESVLSGYERILPVDHPDLLMARAHLAGSLEGKGDVAGARALYESVLAGYERAMPEDHPDLLRVRGQVASSMALMGDQMGARALKESVLLGFERSLPEGHPDLIAIRGNLAVSLSSMGDFDGAHALYEAALADRRRFLPEGHPDLLKAEANLASSMESMGDPAGARSLLEPVVAGYKRMLPEEHPDFLWARETLASILTAMGESVEARAICEQVFRIRERTLSKGHPDLLRARGNLAHCMSNMDDLAEAHALLAAQVEGITVRIMAGLALAPRQVRQIVADEAGRHSDILSLSKTAGPDLERSAFELTETLRLVAAESARSLVQVTEDPELAPILARAAVVRGELADLVAGAAREGASSADLSTELTRLSFERDALEREACGRLAKRGVVTRPVDADRLREALRPGDLAIGYRRVADWEVSEKSDGLMVGADHMIAHVLAPDGTLTRVDLGHASALEESVGAWRTALGAPIRTRGALDVASPLSETGTFVADASRGIVFSTGNGGSVTEVAELAAGRSLRIRILDPILAAVKVDVKRLFICADDLLFLLPLDALPFDTEGEEPVRVGDRLQVVNGVSFARLLSPVLPDPGEASLLSMGGVDYDASGAVPAGRSSVSPPTESDDTSERNGPATRGAIDGGFRNLVQARHEAEGIATLFEEAFESAPALLTRKNTTKAALFESAPGKRYLHLATHGWFAPESVRSTEDARQAGKGVARMGIEDRVSGLAPMTLCGLALAGANRGRDSLGRVPGILTAEELCSLDLSRCELAVLSACETNVGIRRAGQGIQSLQSALYAAGARTSITSLWKVDDAATRRLMEVFYTNLWIEKMPKAEALWQAKQALRDEGHPPAHWAGWVLTGDPE